MIHSLAILQSATPCNIYTLGTRALIFFDVSGSEIQGVAAETKWKESQAGEYITFRGSGMCRLYGWDLGPNIL